MNGTFYMINVEILRCNNNVSLSTCHDVSLKIHLRKIKMYVTLLYTQVICPYSVISHELRQDGGILLRQAEHPVTISILGDDFTIRITIYIKTNWLLYLLTVCSIFCTLSINSCPFIWSKYGHLRDQRACSIHTLSSVSQFFRP
jgi:hypothetical protein